jgi:hypothetical protein
MNNMRPFDGGRTMLMAQEQLQDAVLESSNNYHDSRLEDSSQVEIWRKADGSRIRVVWAWRRAYVVDL